MKNLSKILLALLIVMSLSLSLFACGGVCVDHVDANDDGKCDNEGCDADWDDGCDNHVDANDDGKCDVEGCAADFTDGCDNHVDADDNGKCDVEGCNKDFTDGCDNHVDADDNGKCDVEGCNKDFTDGCDNHVDADDNGKCDVEGCNKDFTDGCDNHVDEDDDGVCDVTGCDEACTDGCDNHVDEDDDGVCDVTGCDEACTDGCDNHIDEDDDGVCDVTGCDEAFEDGCDNHVDEDDDGYCDVDGCSEAYTDGCDNHRDANDDGVCDVQGCDEPWDDGCDADHADTDDNGKCDFGGEAFDDGCDNHVDEDDDGVCDVTDCDEAYTDGCDTKICLDSDDDGLCDNAGCDKETTNKPGDSFATAIELQLDTATAANIATSGQKLYFKFTATAAKIDLSIKGGYYPKCIIYSADNTDTALYTASSYSNVLNKTYEFTEGEIYYVVVTNLYNETANYTVTLTEWVDPFETATVITPSETSTQLSFAVDQIIYYKYVATVTGDYRISANAGYNYVKVTVCGSDRSEIATLGGNYTSKFDTTQALTAGETYYLVVAMPGLYSANSLTFTFALPAVECTEHVDEKNNDTDAAGADGKCDVCGETVTTEEPEPTTPDGTSFTSAIPLEEDATVSIPSSTMGQKFYYSFTASATGAYAITVDGFYFTFNIYAENDTTSPIKTWPYYSGEQTTLVTFEESATYYIVLTSDYGYNVDITVSASDEEVPGFDNAVALEDGVMATGNAAIGTTYYKFTATTSGDYRIILDATYYSVTIYRDDRTSEVKTWSSLYEAVEEVVELEAGTYYFVLSDSWGYYGHELTVAQKLDCNGNCVDEDDDARCDNCYDVFSDGCDLTDCLDINNDGLCDNANCDEPTTNKAEGSTFDKAHELSLDTAKEASITISGQKIYFRFTADKSWYNIKVQGYYSTITVYSADDTATQIFSASASGSTIDKMFEVTVGKDYYIVLGSTSMYNYTLTLSEGSDPFANLPTLTTGSYDFAAKEEKLFTYTAGVTGNHTIYFAVGYAYAKVTVYASDGVTVLGTYNDTYVNSVYAVNASQFMEEGETYYISILSNNSSAKTFDITFTAPEQCTAHVDADDNGECDNCKAAYTDGCDGHVDKDDNGVCDTDGCEEAFTDGCDTKDCYDSDSDGKCDNDACDKTTQNKPGYNAEHAITLEDGAEQSGSLGYNKTVYYKLTASATGTYIIILNGASYELSIYADANVGSSTAVLTLKTDYSTTEREDTIELTAGTTYYFALKSVGYYDYKLIAAVKGECNGHVDANDDLRCDNCYEKHNDGCDLKECIDVTGDGLCDNENCDEETSNKAAGSAFENAIDLTLGEATPANIIVSGQKIYFKFTATSTKLDLSISGGSYIVYSIYDDTMTEVYTAQSSYSSSIMNTYDNFEEGKTYYIAISNQNNYTSNYSLTLSVWANPFDAATELTPSAETKSVPFSGRDVYYKYTATATGDHHIYIKDWYYTATVTVYDADRNVIGDPIVATYDSSSWCYVVDHTQTMTKGETYYIVISFTVTSTTFDMTFTAPAAE